MNRKIKLLGVVAALLTQCLALRAITEKDNAVAGDEVVYQDEDVRRTLSINDLVAYPEENLPE